MAQCPNLRGTQDEKGPAHQEGSPGLDTGDSEEDCLWDTGDVGRGHRRVSDCGATPNPRRQEARNTAREDSEGPENKQVWNNCGSSEGIQRGKAAPSHPCQMWETDSPTDTARASVTRVSAHVTPMRIPVGKIMSSPQQPCTSDPQGAP